MNTLRHRGTQGQYNPGGAGGGGGGVTSIIAGDGIEVDQPTGAVTITATGSGVDSSISSLADLAAIPTTTLTPPQASLWIQSSDGTFQAWQLRAGTDATGAGVQRPDDYAGTTNEKVWYQIAT